MEDITGQVLLHADLHAGNLLAQASRVRIVDWPMACQGAPWVDIALLIPRLIDADHTPEQAEQAAARLPAWGAAPTGAVTALAATRTLFAERLTTAGPELLRPKRRRMAAAYRAWVEYRTA
ncbi:phosphotransferase [Streptosporangium sandarakinum]|uniref:phosphotransferase n=1 Tax=Streptosporangium sandarakinum TaxID=1260955 RepID=UPI00369687C5